MKIKITVEQTSQGIRLYTIFRGYLVHRDYLYYSKSEAIKLFKQYLKEL